MFSREAEDLGCSGGVLMYVAAEDKFRQRSRMGVFQQPSL